jgi:MoaA/NifB/PqqE/SkfB family radical SAM enzyme
LDGKDPASHDGFRGVSGSFNHTLQILDWCREFGLETQIHTTVTRHVLADLPAIADLIAGRSIKLWALFMLIAIGRAARPDVRRLNLNALQFEALFHWLYEVTKAAPFDVTPREGYHYRVFCYNGEPPSWVSASRICSQRSKRITGRQQILRLAIRTTRIVRARSALMMAKVFYLYRTEATFSPAAF